MRLLLAFFLLFGWLHAEEAFYSDEPDIQQKVLYLNYVKVPERVYQGELFSLTIKALSTEDHFQEIEYDFRNGRGYERIETQTHRERDGRYFIDTFYFRCTSSKMRTPDIVASLRFSEFSVSATTRLAGKSVRVITLNPPETYANILADAFSITKYKTTRYNDKANIAIFTAKAKRSHIEAFHLKPFAKQGIESVTPAVDESVITYYAVIPRNLEHLKFKYFNLKSERYVDVLIPIVVEDDAVSTQSDLKPIEHRHTQLKVLIATGFALVSFFILLFRKKIIYLIPILVAGAYIAYSIVPTEMACIKAGSPIYLLPMEKGTTFEITTKQITLEVQGNVDGFAKVKLQNNKIGWVRHEDLCNP